MQNSPPGIKSNVVTLHVFVFCYFESKNETFKSLRRKQTWSVLPRSASSRSLIPPSSRLSNHLHLLVKIGYFEDLTNVRVKLRSLVPEQRGASECCESETDLLRFISSSTHRENSDTRREREKKHVSRRMLWTRVHIEVGEITRAEREAGTCWRSLSASSLLLILWSLNQVHRREPAVAITGEWLLPVVDNDSP